MLHPAPGQPQTAPDVAELAMERDLYLATARDLQGQLDAERVERKRVQRVLDVFAWMLLVGLTVVIALGLTIGFR